MIQGTLALLRRALGDKPSKPPIARSIPIWQQAQALTPTTDVAALTNEGYRRNVVVYCCIQELATSTAGLPLRARKVGGADLELTHPLSRLLRRPNPEQSRFALVEGAWINLKSAGIAYIHKVRNSSGMPIQLWNLRPDRMQPIADNYGIKAYEYKVEGLQPQRIPANDVIRISHVDPLDDYFGLSPLAVAARAIDLDNKGLDYLRAFFLNGAAPAGILRFKEPTEPDERERIRQLWKQLYGSARGWHELAVLDAFAEYQEIGSRPESLGMDAVWGTTETRICSVFGVPPILVQLRSGIQRSTFSNYREAVKSFWTETILPDSVRLIDGLTLGLLDEFSDEIEIYADTTNVEVLHEAMKDKREAAASLYSAGLISLNEGRKMIGHNPIPGGDELSPEDKLRRGAMPSKNQDEEDPDPDGEKKGKSTEDKDAEDDDEEEESSRRAPTYTLDVELPPDVLEALARIRGEK